MCGDGGTGDLTICTLTDGEEGGFRALCPTGSGCTLPSLGTTDESLDNGGGRISIGAIFSSARRIPGGGTEVFIVLPVAASLLVCCGLLRLPATDDDLVSRFSGNGNFPDTSLVMKSVNDFVSIGPVVKARQGVDVVVVVVGAEVEAIAGLFVPS